MPTLPESEIYLLVRTYFADDVGWDALRAEIDRGSEEGFLANVEYVDDRQFEDFSPDALQAAHPHRTDGWDVMYVADEQAITHPAHPVLVVRVCGTEDLPFRCRADLLYEVDANLSLANLDWDDFRDQVDQSGVYGGNGIVTAPKPAPATAPEVDGTSWTAGYGDGDDDRREAAEIAGRRIGADLDGAPHARPLSGHLGTANIEVSLPREISRIWPLIANLDITNMSSPHDAALGNEFSMSTYDPDEDGFVGSSGQIICKWTELDEPIRVAMTWRWTGTAYEPPVTTVTATLTDRSTNSQQPLTHLVLTHADLPAEWVEDMTAIWMSKVDQCAYQAMSRKRGR